MCVGMRLRRIRTSQRDGLFVITFGLISYASKCIITNYIQFFLTFRFFFLHTDTIYKRPIKLHGIRSCASPKSCWIIKRAVCARCLELMWFWCPNAITMWVWVHAKIPHTLCKTECRASQKQTLFKQHFLVWQNVAVHSSTWSN